MHHTPWTYLQINPSVQQAKAQPIGSRLSRIPRMIREAQDYSNDVNYADEEEVSFHAPGRGQGLPLGPVKVKGKLAPGQGPTKGAGGAKGAVRRNKKGQGLGPGQDPSINHNHQHHPSNHQYHHHNNNYNDGNTPSNDFPAGGPGLGPGSAQGQGLAPGQIDPLADYPPGGEVTLVQTPGTAQSVSTSARRPVPHYR